MSNIIQTYNALLKHGAAATSRNNYPLATVVHPVFGLPLLRLKTGLSLGRYTPNTIPGSTHTKIAGDHEVYVDKHNILNITRAT